MSSVKRLLIVGPINGMKISGPLDSLTLLSKNLDQNYEIETRTFLRCSFNYKGINVFPLKIVDILKSDLIILTGLYQKFFLFWLITSLILRKPVIISPRGNLTDASLNKSKIRKKIYLKVFFLIARNRVKFHFLSRREYKNSTSIGNEIFFVAHNFRDNQLSKGNISFQERNNNIVYIGRYDIYHKGLDKLLLFISENKQILTIRGIRLELFGPSRNDGYQKIIKKVKQLGLDDIIKVNGPLNKSEINSVLQRSRYFIHYSRYEGVPQSVLDAYACGCGLLVTDGCNLAEDIYASNRVFVLDSDNNVKNYFDQKLLTTKDICSEMLDNDLIRTQYVQNF